LGAAERHGRRKERIWSYLNSHPVEQKVWMKCFLMHAAERLTLSLWILLHSELTRTALLLKTHTHTYRERERERESVRARVFGNGSEGFPLHIVYTHRQHFLAVTNV